MGGEGSGPRPKYQKNMEKQIRVLHGEDYMIRLFRLAELSPGEVIGTVIANLEASQDTDREKKVLAILKGGL